MVELCRRVLDGFGMLVEWTLGILVPIFKGKGDIMKLQFLQSRGAY